MPMGILSGFAIKMTPIGPDHTYVSSSLGHAWGCWGGSAGGRSICSGNGNCDQADCLSHPNAQAGISYGVTGVCHQTANRILFPAAQTVSQAWGYRASILIWGVYGTDPASGQQYSPAIFPWPELAHCAQNHVHP